jgi:hypothetical protein
MHIGQHGAADYALVIRRTRPANEIEPDVRELREELEEIGYRLIVRKRRPAWKKLLA